MKITKTVQDSSFLSRLDWNLILVILTLNIVGLINLYSATHGLIIGPEKRLFWQQLVWMSAGWCCFFILTFINYIYIKRFIFIFYLLNVGALIAVDLVGKIYYGAQRWLDLGFFRFQPSETVKLAIVLYLAQFLSRKKYSEEGMGFKDLIFPMLITMIPFLLTVKQPDLGTGLLILGITFSMLFFVKIKKTVLITLSILMALSIPVVWTFGLKTYQKNRILTFISPHSDPRGTGYNSLQSKIAVGSGQILGKGFRRGTQSQLEFIPERHSDFIFSVLSEEYGFIGSASVIVLYLILYLLGIKTASEAKDKFGVLMTVGCLSVVFWHMFINMGMVIGILPIVGVPLPLISYGGSSLLASMTSLGLISSVAYRKFLF